MPRALARGFTSVRADSQAWTGAFARVACRRRASGERPLIVTAHGELRPDRPSHLISLNEPALSHKTLSTSIILSRLRRLIRPRPRRPLHQPRALQTHPIITRIHSSQNLAPSMSSLTPSSSVRPATRMASGSALGHRRRQRPRTSQSHRDFYVTLSRTRSLFPLTPIKV